MSHWDDCLLLMIGHFYILGQIAKINVVHKKLDSQFPLHDNIILVTVSRKETQRCSMLNWPAYTFICNYV